MNWTNEKLSIKIRTGLNRSFKDPKSVLLQIFVIYILSYINELK